MPTGYLMDEHVFCLLDAEQLFSTKELRSHGSIIKNTDVTVEPLFCEVCGEQVLTSVEPVTSSL